MSRRAVIAVLAAAVCSACATGERPSFSDSPSAPGESTGDAAADEVLQRLDQAGSARFVAGYTILTRFGSLETDAEVAQLSAARRTVTIGDVQFRFEGRRTTTCELDRSECSPEIRDNLVSDTQVTHRFYAEEAAARLRRDATSRVGNTTAEDVEIAGQSASCVSIPLDGGTARYCALENGVLALDDDADVRIELTEYRDDVADVDLARD